MEVQIQVLDFEELSAAASLLAPAANNPSITLNVSQILHKHAASSALPPLRSSSDHAPPNLTSAPQDRSHNLNSTNALPTDETMISSNNSNAAVRSVSTASSLKDSTTSLYLKEGRSVDDDEMLLEVANSTVKRLVRALGPAGPGLVAVRGFSRVRELRQKLLPLAQTLSLMPHSQLQTLLKDNGLGTDVQLKKMDRGISSFAAQVDFTKLRNSYEMHDDGDGCKDLDMLGDLFRALGTCFVEVGLLIARLCDIAFPHATLEQSILESGTAKGRLIHYHSPVERFSGANGGSKCNLAAHKNSCDFSFCNKSDQTLGVKQINLAGSEMSSPQRMWQQWHYDYGILTVVTAPMFRVAPTTSGKMEFSSSSTADPSTLAECLPPDDHSCLYIMNPSTGLAQHVVVSDDLLIVQVGEAAQILSGGNLRATAHCVSELVSKSDVSRETFVLFLQPSWQKPLVPPEGYNRSMVLGAGSWVDEESRLNKSTALSVPDFNPSTPRSSPFQGDSPDLKSQILAFNKSVPPLASRWHECSTFAEFSKQTTRQYYGANGCQSNH